MLRRWSEIRCPADVVAICDPYNSFDEIQQNGFVVLDTFGKQYCPHLVNHDAMMRPLARVDSADMSASVRSLPFLLSLALSITTPARPYPTITVVILNSAVELSAGSGRPFPVSRPRGRET